MKRVPKIFRLNYFKFQFISSILRPYWCLLSWENEVLFLKLRANYFLPIVYRFTYFLYTSFSLNYLFSILEYFHLNFLEFRLIKDWLFDLVRFNLVFWFTRAFFLYISIFFLLLLHDYLIQIY